MRDALKPSAHARIQGAGPWTMLSAAAALLLSLADPAQAAYRTEAGANAHIGGVCCNAFQFTTGPEPSHDLEQDIGVNEPAQAAASVIDQVIDSTRPSGWLYRRQSLATAEAGAGVLKAVATAGFFADGYRTFESVTARAVARFDDVLRIKGPGSGSTDVVVAFHVSGALGGADRTSFAMAGLNLQGNPLIEFRNDTAGSTGSYTCSEAGGSVTCQGEVTLSLPIDTDLPISGYLGVVASAVGVPGRDNASAHYGHTAFVQVSLLSPGYSLISDSGHDYASPVPEPEAWAAMLAGLLGLAVVRGAARRSRPLFTRVVRVDANAGQAQSAVNCSIA